MTLVSVSDLQNYMSGVTFTAAQLATANMVLPGLQADLEKRIHRKFEPTLVQEERQASANGEIRFRYAPITNFISLTSQFGEAIPIHQSGGEDANTPLVPALTTQELTTYGATTKEDHIGTTFYGDSIIGFGTFGTPFNIPMLIPYQWYVAKYVTQYITDKLDDVKLKILRAAEREMVTRHDDSLTVQGGIYKPMAKDDDLIIGWTDEEIASFGAMRRRAMAG